MLLIAVYITQRSCRLLLVMTFYCRYVLLRSIDGHSANQCFYRCHGFQRSIFCSELCLQRYILALFYFSGVCCRLCSLQLCEQADQLLINCSILRRAILLLPSSIVPLETLIDLFPIFYKFLSYLTCLSCFLQADLLLELLIYIYFALLLKKSY